MEVKYCSNCGSTLETRLVNEEARLACPNCEYVYWGNYSVSVGGIMFKEDKVLLVRRMQNPGRGNWTVPGGYVEQTEEIGLGVVREIQEETTVTGRVCELISIADKPAHVHNVYLNFMMEYVSGSPQADHKEIDATGFFSLKEMALMQVPDLTKELVQLALEKRRGLHKNHHQPNQLNGFHMYNV
jgi:ADP-ribose pyrophosphatase YjhB (NUDIX family)